MGVKLKLKSKMFNLEADMMKDGQIGISENGKILQKYHNKVITVGEDSGEGYSNGCSILVRVLKDGEKIIITNNQ